MIRQRRIDTETLASGQNTEIRRLVRSAREGQEGHNLFENWGRGGIQTPDGIGHVAGREQPAETRRLCPQTALGEVSSDL